ncbi:MAG: polyribonucleotide nucleotidyltransferase, partial [Candidatus Liptonbacteria bacterium]|nr:polyribonucleotide nucleotidyltransferase [Candidatus Liptonbacteria bacterium]
MNADTRRFEIEVGGKPLAFGLSSIAERANAAVVGKYGETVVLVTAVMSPHDSGAHYMPLRVDYEERFYAAGKIIGSR